jgi:hypothetical protein
MLIEQLGVSAITVSKMLNGMQQPDSQMLTKIANMQRSQKM